MKPSRISGRARPASPLPAPSPRHRLVGLCAAAVLAAGGCTGTGIILDDPNGGGNAGGGAGAAASPGGAGDPGGQGQSNGSGAPGGSTPGGGSVPGAAASGPGRLRRLTRAQFVNTLRDLLPGGATVALGDLEPDDQREGFASIGASYAATSPNGVEKYETAARAALDAVFADPARRASLFGCTPAAADDDCARSFITGFGRRTWRRPLSSTEVERYLRLSRTVGTSFGDPIKGLQHAALGLLTSPNFLYRVEIGEAAGTGSYRYNGWELASRLSYLLWNTTPDAELLTAAESGSLGGSNGAAGLRQQVARLLASDRAKSGISTFASELFALDDIAMVPKDDERATPALRDAMAAEIRRMFESRLDPEADMLELFDSNKVFVNADLAKIYGLSGITGSDLQPATLPAGPRAGLLGTAGFLTLHSKDQATSPTSRGLFVREGILCTKVPDPPDGVDTTIKDPPAGVVMTRRELLEGHRSNPMCATCHAVFDPIGYAFESFDWVGAARDQDMGKPVDTSGEIDGQRFGNARELGAILRKLPATSQCLVRNFFRFASGHSETPADQASLDAWQAEFGQSGNKLVPFLAALASSDAFRLVSAAP